MVVCDGNVHGAWAIARRKTTPCDRAQPSIAGEVGHGVAVDGEAISAQGVDRDQHQVRARGAGVDKP